MPMQATLNLLLELQKVDRRLAGLEEEKQSLPVQRKKIEADLQTTKEKPEKLAEEMKSIRIELDKRELDLKVHEGRLAQLTIRLNLASSNKEYRAIKQEIGSEEADKSLLEDEILNLMTGCDELEASLKQAKEELEEEKKRCEKALQEIEEREASLKREIKELLDLRKELGRQVALQVLSTYDRLIGRYKTDAVVPVSAKEMVCSGCHISVQVQTINLLMRNDEIIRCKTCGRILYLE